MTKTLDEKVEQWFIDRNLHEANPVKQFEKLMEEAGELFEGVAKSKSDLIKDALGDMQVVLTGLELQVKNGADIRATPEEMELLLMVASLGNLANKLHKHVFYDETKIPLIKPDLIMLHSNIHSVAIHNCTTADTCLKIAYDEIKDRKGKMIDGVFVKEGGLVRKTLTGIGNFCILLSILVTPLLILYKLDKLDAKIEQPKIIVHQVDNAGAEMVGIVTDKEIIQSRYIVTVGAYGKFMVTKKQYDQINIGDPIPNFLKGRGS